MAGHQLTYATALAASALFVAACSFDTSVKFEADVNSTGGGGGFSADAAPSPDASRDDFRPDAGTGQPQPDATPVVPDGTLQSTRRTQTIVLDGELDSAWQSLTFVDFAIGDAAQLETVSGYVADANVRIASMYDASRIYFFLEVHDDLLVDDSDDTYNDDSIELYIDGLNDRSGPFGNDDHWLTIGAEGLYASLGPNEVDIAGSILVTPVGYNIEIAFERTELGAGTNTLLGFNIAINDDDNHGNSAVDAYGLWHVPSSPECSDCCDGFSENYPWCDTSRLGQLQLVP